LESESNQEGETQKSNRVDLLAEDSAGQRLIIGVQNEREADYLERLVFGTSKIITENVALGEECRSIVKVISISILYFNLGAGDNDYVYYGATEFRGLHTRKPLPVKEREVYSPDGKFRMHGKNIFTEYYLINVERFEDVIENDLDEWIYMLKHETLRDDFHAPNIDKARKKLPLLEMSLKEYKRYERYMMNLAIERDVIETAKAEGFAEGLSRMEER
ncbi:MAG: hypothetical protein GY862_33240, partial [Gammaproteobacteria bacterium]|nr:hypothetical protein [Gammaproteobacteria bacterium]